MMTKYGNSNPQQELMLLRAKLNSMQPNDPAYSETVNYIQMLENQASTVDSET